jgi:hypothetical protein
VVIGAAVIVSLVNQHDGTAKHMHTRARLCRAGTAATIANPACNSFRNHPRTRRDCGVVIEDHVHVSTRGPGNGCSRRLPLNYNGSNNCNGCTTSRTVSRLSPLPRSQFYAAAAGRTSYGFPSATAAAQIEPYPRVDRTWPNPGGSQPDSMRVAAASKYRTASSQSR